MGSDPGTRHPSAALLIAIGSQEESSRLQLRGVDLGQSMSQHRGLVALRGLKMRTMENPIHIEAYRQFGILPTPMAFTEVFTALQQGTVDGQENPLSVITSAKLDQVQKYLSLTGHVYSPAVFLMNKAQWDKLSDADKQAFLEAAREGVKANRARVDEDERRAVADLRAKGMNVTENLDKAKFQTVLSPVYADFAKRFGQANIDRIKDYR